MSIEYEGRRKRIEKYMKKPSLLLSFSGKRKHSSLDITYEFEVERNFYYLTGLDEPGCVLALFKSIRGVSVVLFVPRLSKYDEVLLGETKDENYYREKTGIQTVMYIENLESQIRLQFMFQGITTVYFCQDRPLLDGETTVECNVVEWMMKSLPGIEIGNLNGTLKKMRSVKDDNEIERIKKASELTARGVQSLMRGIGPGRYEYQLAADFLHEILVSGGRKEGFPTMVASGGNTRILHYEKKTEMLREGDLVLVDLGADFEHYSSDVSRTFPVSGKYSDVQRYWYEICLKAQEMIIEKMKPGALISESGTDATEYVAEKLVENGLAKSKEGASNLYEPNWAGIGGPNHQVGLNAHDDCNLEKREDDVFIPGQIYAVEPGIYLKDLGFGIRIEDVVLITENGHEVITDMIPKDPDQIEEIMRER